MTPTWRFAVSALYDSGCQPFWHVPPSSRALSACHAFLSRVFTSCHLNKPPRRNKVKSSSISHTENQANKRSIGICEAGLWFLFFATPLIFLWPLSFVLWPTWGVTGWESLCNNGQLDELLVGPNVQFKPFNLRRRDTLVLIFHIFSPKFDRSDQDLIIGN